MITHYFKTNEHGVLQTSNEPAVGGWTHVVTPTNEEFEIIIQKFNLDPSIIEDIKDEFEIPRYEQEGSISYFFTRFLNDNKQSDIDTSPLLIIMGTNFLVTISNQEAPFLNQFIAREVDVHTTLRTRLFLEIVWALIAHYGKILNLVRKSVHRDVGSVRNIKARDIQRLVLFEQELNEILSALLPTNGWLQQLTKGNHIQMFSDDRELLEDLLIESGQLVDSAKSILKTIQNIRSASESVLTQQLNSTIRVLTAFTIILTIPTLIASLFGMNVPLPFEGQNYGFWVIVSIIVFLMILTVHFFVRNKWI